MLWAMKIPKKLPKDANQRAYEIVRLSTEEPEEPDTPAEPAPATEEPKKERSAISEYLAAIGRKGGLKGGRVRSERLTPEKRKEIALKAAKVRWNKK
jgi:hypothetical protein